MFNFGLGCSSPLRASNKMVIFMPAHVTIFSDIQGAFFSLVLYFLTFYVHYVYTTEGKAKQYNIKIRFLPHIFG